MPLRLTSKQLFSLHLVLLLFLLLLIPFESRLPPYQEILSAGGAWRVDVRADPLYKLRSGLLLTNLFVVGMGSVLTAFSFGQAFVIGKVEGALASLCLTTFKALVGLICAPFWVNGVHHHFPIPDMDPKALPPAIWFPDPAFWQMLGFEVILMGFLVLFGSMAGGVFIFVRERRIPFVLLLSQLALVAFYLWFIFTPEIGTWFAD